MRKLGQRGDTIVEVLIAIAIISLVLMAAYMTASRNIVAVQNNQERVQAQHLVEGQIEALKSTGAVPAHGAPCFLSAITPAAADCTQVTAPGSGATYKLQITTSSPSVYTISAVWTSIDSTTEDDANVTMYYRLQ